MVAAALDDYGGTLPQFRGVRVRFQLLQRTSQRPLTQMSCAGTKIARFRPPATTFVFGYHLRPLCRLLVGGPSLLEGGPLPPSKVV